MTVIAFALNTVLMVGVGSTIWFKFLLISFIAVLCYEITTYIQHYGLERNKMPNGQYEKMQPCYAWHHTGVVLISMYNLQRHGDHHTNLK